MFRSNRSPRSCCCLLVVSLLLQLAPVAQAQTCDGLGALRQAYDALLEARDILTGGRGVWHIQGANLPLDQARRLVGSYPFANCYPRLSAELRRSCEKARVQVLWNDAGDAIEIINRALGKIERALESPQSYANRRETSVRTGWLAAPIIGGLGAFLIGWARHWNWNWGQVSTGGIGRNIPANLGHGSPILVH